MHSWVPDQIGLHYGKWGIREVADTYPVPNTVMTSRTRKKNTQALVPTIFPPGPVGNMTGEG